MKEDKDLEQLKKRLLLGILVMVVILVPFTCLFLRKTMNKSDVLKKYNHKKTFMVLVTNSNEKDKCNSLKKTLKNKDISYVEYNLDKTYDKDRVLPKFGVSYESINVPMLVYVYKGKTVIRVMNVYDESVLDDFLSECSKYKR